MAVKTKAKGKFRFRLLTGLHRQNGKNLKKGDVVTTDKDLAKKFGKDKFKRLKVSDPDVDEDTQPRERPTKKKKRSE